MKKISMAELKSMLESDKKLADKLKEHLNGETDANIVGEKTIEFMRKEGYEIDEHSLDVLSMDKLENVSGGFTDEQKASMINTGVGAAGAIAGTAGAVVLAIVLT